jgi:hypothetical protein
MRKVVEREYEERGAAAGTTKDETCAQSSASKTKVGARIVALTSHVARNSD